MQELGIQQVCSQIDDAFKRNDFKRVESLLWPALDQFPDLAQLWFYAGNVAFQLGRVALSVQCFERCIELDENPLVLANLGAAYRRLNKHEEGKRVLATCLDRDPDYQPALVNMGSMFVNEGSPEEGIPYLERACELGDERGATWNLGLLYLEVGRFGEGFDLYRKGLGAERMMRTYGAPGKDIPEPKVLEPTDVRAGKTLIVWGEQGIGDELMFASIIKDAQGEFGEVIFECHPRLLNLHRRAFPGMRLYPTRKEDYIGWPIADRVVADYKCPLGDLAAIYRRDAASFKTAWDTFGPTYAPAVDRTESAEYRARLEAMAGGRPIIGLATRGGVIQTARTFRTLRVGEADRLFASTDCLFVCLDYDDMSGFAQYVTDKYGESRYAWLPAVAQHWDFDHTAALMEACDMVVTVCQSAAHLSAHCGVPTRILTPKACAWRYGVQGEQWYWTPSPTVKLYRQGENGWEAPITRVIDDIRAMSLKAAA